MVDLRLALSLDHLGEGSRDGCSKWGKKEELAVGRRATRASRGWKGGTQVRGRGGGHPAGQCHKRRAAGQRVEKLQQTVLMGSASSVPALLATSCSSSALTSSCSTASTMGITMAVVDVLESHMDSSVVQHMKHSSSLEGRQGWAERRPQGHLPGLDAALPAGGVGVAGALPNPMVLA